MSGEKNDEMEILFLGLASQKCDVFSIEKMRRTLLILFIGDPFFLPFAIRRIASVGQEVKTPDRKRRRERPAPGICK
jgi:hypothetical protein